MLGSLDVAWLQRLPRIRVSTPAEWIGARPASLQLGAILLVGVSGVLIAGLQPILLGTLLQEGRITAAQLGHAATVELLVMGAASAYAGGRWRPARLRTIGIVSALLLAVLDASTAGTSGEAVTLLRALAGAPSGVLIWIAVAMIARSPMPERWSGLYLTLGTLAQFITAAVLTAWVMPRFGANGGWIALAGLCCIAAAAASLLPDGFAELPANEANSELPSARGWTALAAVFAWSAFIVGVWVYVEPLSRQSGHAPEVAGTAVAVSLGCQVLGGVCATLLAGRLRWLPVLVVCAVCNAACLLVFATLPAQWGFLLAAAVFGFLWLFTLPFLVPMVIAADPSRRAAVLVGGAQLLGGGLGPLLVSLLVTDAEARGALVLGAVALTTALLIAAGLHLQTRESSSVTSQRANSRP